MNRNRSLSLLRKGLATVAAAAALGGPGVSAEPAAPGKNPDEAMSWLDNGRIRLGVDLSIGGAVTWLSEAGCGTNMINSADWGRQIQMSFYSGPVPYVPEGATVNPHWKGLGWNPIQSGDVYGTRSRILEHRNDGKVLYVRCVPMHWPLKNVPGECEFESWFQLEGATVLARSRLTNRRPDRTQYAARDQELPAVYCNGPWYKLVSYLGDKPFTDAPPTVLVDRDDGKGWPWRTFYSAEHWAALLDKDDRGVGLYLPDGYLFSGGFSGRKGAGGAKDGPTGYMTARHVELLDHNIVYTYGYTLIVGDLKAIRQYVYDRSRRKAPPAWRFLADRQHWYPRNATDAGWPVREGWAVQLGKKDAALVGPKTFWRAEDAPTLYVRAAFVTKAPAVTVTFQRFDAVDAGDWPQWGESRRPAPGPAGRVPVAIKGDGKVRTLKIDLGGQKDYRGAMTQLCVLLPEEEGTVRVHSIGFSKP